MRWSSAVLGLNQGVLKLKRIGLKGDENIIAEYILSRYRYRLAAMVQV